MKRNLAFITFLLGLVFSVEADGLVLFANVGASVSTNSTASGPATGLTSGTPGQFRYALYYSLTSFSVNGQTAPIVGADPSGNFAFNDPAWTFVAYGTNTAIAGRFISANQNANGYTAVPGVAAGTSVQFVVIGWSANIGTNITAVKSWLEERYTDGFIGQSAVSGALLMGDASFPPTSIFGPMSPKIPGFTLGYSLSGLFEPPFLLVNPTNLTVTAGTTATFPAFAEGDVSLMLSGQWKFNSNNISSGNYSVLATNFFVPEFFYDAGLFTLTITNVQMTNAGYYSVFISNGAGSLITTNALLTVLLPPLQNHSYGNNLQLSWPANAGTYHVSTATNLAGPWADSGLTISSDGTTSSVSVTTTNQSQYFRLVYP